MSDGSIDFNLARILVRDAIRSAVTTTLDEFRNHETVYAFAMAFRDDYYCMNAMAASLEAFESRRRVCRDPHDRKEFLQTKWSWHGGTNAETELLFRHASQYMWDTNNNWEPEHQARYLWTLVKAMKDVADEGLFARGPKKVTLFCTAVDADVFWLQRASARYLNDPDLFAIFSQEHHDQFYEDVPGDPADDFSYIGLKETRRTAELWKGLIQLDHL